MAFAFIGEVAGLLTSVFFSIGPSFFTLAGRSVGAPVVNRTRLLVTFLMLLVIHWFVMDSPLPVEAAPERWFWLSLSGVIGLVIGDAFLFQALIQIGPRLTLLVFSLSPIISAAVAWLFLGESLGSGQIMGIAVTLVGVLWVVSERNNQGGEAEQRRNYLTGLLYALGGAAGQALGLIAAKKGLGGDFSALSGHIIRISSATVVLWIITMMQGQVGATVQRLRERPEALKHIFWGAFFGPLVGVWFSLLAVQYTQVGVASTLMALPPVFLLPIGYFVFNERFGWRAILGTIVALGGVAILFLV